MILKVNRDEIIDGLVKAANIIPAKTGAAYLRTIWLKLEDSTLKIMSTDSNLEFCGAYPVGLPGLADSGLVGVQGRSFVDLARRLPQGEITLKTEEASSNLLLEQGGRKYKLPTNDPNWFQNFTQFPESGSVFWSGDFVIELIDKLAFCISDEDTMEAIACLSMKPVVIDGSKVIEACGLNGHQFSMLRFTHDELHAMLPEGGILIQKKYLLELKKWLSGGDIELAIGDKRLFLRTGDKLETFSLPLSYYQYPDYNNFLSRVKTGGSTLETGRGELMEALERILIFNSDNNRCTYFNLDPGAVTLHSQGQDTGSATESLEEASFTGQAGRIAFPTRNLIDILSRFGSAKTTLTMTGSEGPCGVTGAEDPDYLVIIMPMKIVEETYYSEEDA